MSLKMKAPAWLERAVFYEIYPQSFNDTNGDGIGDLPGVIAKLDYIASLGCDAIWLNPCFESPFQDAGYDIADFYKVAPRYGTNDDLARLFKEASRRGIRVILDLVAGHTSVEHPWFKESCKATPNKYSNWFIWSNSWGEGLDPFRSINGFAERDGNYMINFFYCQPALNYGFAKPDPAKKWQLGEEHPDVKAVRDELKKIMAFWLDMGAAGFRVDMASSLVKGDADGSKTLELWQDYRCWMEKHYPDAILVAEWSKPSKAIPAGFHVDFMVHFNNPGYTALFRQEKWRVGNSPYPDGHSFFDKEGKGDVRLFLDAMDEEYVSTKNMGYVAVPTGNHDIGRIRMGRSDRELECALAAVYTMPGVPFIYYGDEIGMDYVHGLPSKEGGYNRTGARTPMQWDNGKINAGFSSAPSEALYLPLDPSASRPDVSSQEKDGGSILHFTKRMIAMRKASKALSADGSFSVLYGERGRYPFVYLREGGGERWVVAVNPSASKASASFALAGASRFDAKAAKGVRLEIAQGCCRAEMEGCSYCVAKVE